MYTKSLRPARKNKLKQKKKRLRKKIYGFVTILQK